MSNKSANLKTFGSQLNNPANFNKLVNCQSNYISLVGVPLSEFQYNVYLILIHLLNKYNDKPTYSEKYDIHCNEVSFNPHNIPEFTFTKNRNTLSRNIEDLLNVKIKNVEETNGEDKISYSVLFTDASYDFKRKLISVSINPLYMKHFRGFENKYHQYFLQESLNIPGKYTKALYLVLSVYEFKKECVISVKKIRESLCVPDSYRSNDIVRKVIIPLQDFLNSNKSKFSFEYKPIVKNKKIIAFRFYKISNKVPKQGNLLEHYDDTTLFREAVREYLNTLNGENRLSAIDFKFAKAFVNKIGVDDKDNKDKDNKDKDNKDKDNHEKITATYCKDKQILTIDISIYYNQYDDIENLLCMDKDLFRFVFTKYFPQFKILEYKYR